MKSPKAILITGATGAIGGALAREYAREGVTLYLQGRRSERLEVLAAECEGRGANVLVRQVDMRDEAALRAWLEEVATGRAPELVIVNAGINTHPGPGGDPEPWAEVDALLDVNLRAAMIIVDRLVPWMRERGRGQIAFISSLAGHFGLPVTPAYSASKAGLKAYGEALRGWLAPAGIEVNVIMPGYVESPMCEAMPGPKPFLLSPDTAAQRIRIGLARNRARITFPWPLNWGTWWLSVLPPDLSIRILGWLGYGR